MTPVLVWTVGIVVISFGMGRRPWRRPRARRCWYVVAKVAAVVLVLELLGWTAVTIAT